MQDTGEPHRNGPDTQAEESGPRSSCIPDQHLSPVLNPLLANQLGRWAEIYYTTPAENRDEAVRQLLQQLEAEAQSGSASRESGQAEKADGEAGQPADFPALLESQTAFPPGEVHHQFGSAAQPPDGLPQMEISEAEHLADLSDPFLSNRTLSDPTVSDQTLSDPDLPGPDLSDFDSRESPFEAPAVQKHEELSNTPISKEHQDTPAVWPGMEAVESVIASSQETPQLPAIAPMSGIQEEEDWSAKSAPQDEAIEPQATATSALFEPSQDSPPDFSVVRFRRLVLPAAATVRRIPRRIAVAALLVVGFTALVWDLRRGTETSRTTPSRTPTTAVLRVSKPPAAGTSTLETEPSQGAPNDPRSDRRDPAQTTSDRADSATVQIAKPADEKTVIERSKVEKPAPEKLLPERSWPETSDPDLEAGLQYLRGNPAERNSAEAARYLWKSVSRQNGMALVELAGLYAKGDGVAKDCEQARILMEAASRHKVSKMGIALETLRDAGCE